jgi:hypothetical protein
MVCMIFLLQRLLADRAATLLSEVQILKFFLRVRSVCSALSRRPSAGPMHYQVPIFFSPPFLYLTKSLWIILHPALSIFVVAALVIFVPFRTLLRVAYSTNRSVSRFARLRLCESVKVLSFSARGENTSNIFDSHKRYSETRLVRGRNVSAFRTPNYIPASA